MNHNKTGIGNGPHATNNVKASLFSEKFEERITVAVEKIANLADSLTPKKMTEEQTEKFLKGLKSVFGTKDAGVSTNPGRGFSEADFITKIKNLETRLAEANAKLSGRL
ncbi:hypothetical protein KAU11_11150 [Candidatus Babeliales bacterium]|nr:hypothetical protein [Candidatus Babeliales bacterium]